MMMIRALFDPSRQIDRRIEKVIQFDNVDPELLKREIGEYVVTESMTRSFEKLLDAIDEGMQEGSNEVGAWISGFYGSGKSSFTKYLGFALDDSCNIDGKPFLRYLQDRITDAPLRQRVATVSENRAVHDASWISDLAFLMPQSRPPRLLYRLKTVRFLGFISGLLG